jgi:hypothetical protein
MGIMLDFRQLQVLQMPNTECYTIWGLRRWPITSAKYLKGIYICNTKMLLNKAWK